MSKYKIFSLAFSYPENGFFLIFPQLVSQKDGLIFEFDRLFRKNEIWLYAEEYIAENEFQRVRGLSDINGFYRAFGLEVDKDRPDLLTSELEFMHYLIFKETKAKNKENAFICFEAQKKFFSEHLFPAAEKISERVLKETKNNFYKVVAQELADFLKSEKRLFKKN